MQLRAGLGILLKTQQTRLFSSRGSVLDRGRATQGSDIDCGNHETKEGRFRPVRSFSSRSSEATVTPSSSPAYTLTSTDLWKSARLARLSGLCYYSPDALASGVREEGLKLVAEGQNSFTRWFIVEGNLRPAPWGSDSVTASTAMSTAGQPKSQGPTTNPMGPIGSDGPGLESDTAPPAPLPPRRERFILIRGLKASDPGSSETWRQLMRFFPVPFEADRTLPRGSVVAHEGLYSMAKDLVSVLEPLISEEQPGAGPGGRAAPLPVTFAGHSMGGALSILLACITRLRGLGKESRAVAFGAPPVLAHQTGGGSAPALWALQMPPPALRSFVLDNDPVPRAFLAVDPFFQAVKSLTPVASLLAMRDWLVGPGGPFSTDRFLFEKVGEAYLLRWMPEDFDPNPSPRPSSPSGTTGTTGAATGTTGSSARRALQRRVVPLKTCADMESHLKLALSDLTASPIAAIRAVADHHHYYYVQELEAASKAAAHLELEAAQAAQAAGKEQTQQAQQLQAAAAAGVQMLSKGSATRTQQQAAGEAAVATVFAETNGTDDGDSSSGSDGSATANSNKAAAVDRQAVGTSR